MPPIPRDPAFDSTLALFSEGYLFISNRCRQHRSDIFETRLMLRRATCVMGEAAAALFYESDRFTRRGATPTPALTLLQDRESVQTLDGPAHRRRKGMFMSLMGPESIQALVAETERQWRGRMAVWTNRPEIVLFDEVEEILCRAVCNWAGVPLDDSESTRRTRELSAMVEGAGSVGPRNWRGQFLRARTERWARHLVGQARAGLIEPPEVSALRSVAMHRDAAGALLDERVAAVELINLLRPTVAIARYVIFAALALHRRPDCRERLIAGSDAEREAFVQEVRRFFPFFPFVGGRVREGFDWRGHPFREGEWVLLDLYGTNHDARIWQDPEAFRPERFDERRPGPDDLVPQGGGDHHAGHRCPGEWITIALLKSAVRMLTMEMRYSVPEQDLTVSLARMPALPRSRFVITDVHQPP